MYLTRALHGCLCVLHIMVEPDSISMKLVIIQIIGWMCMELSMEIKVYRTSFESFGSIQN